MGFVLFQHVDIYYESLEKWIKNVITQYMNHGILFSHWISFLSKCYLGDIVRLMQG